MTFERHFCVNTTGCPIHGAHPREDGECTCKPFWATFEELTLEGNHCFHEQRRCRAIGGACFDSDDLVITQVYPYRKAWLDAHAGGVMTFSGSFAQQLTQKMTRELEAVGESMDAHIIVVRGDLAYWFTNNLVQVGGTEAIIEEPW